MGEGVIVFTRTVLTVFINYSLDAAHMVAKQPFPYSRMVGEIGTNCFITVRGSLRFCEITRDVSLGMKVHWVATWDVGVSVVVARVYSGTCAGGTGGWRFNQTKGVPCPGDLGCPSQNIRQTIGNKDKKTRKQYLL